MPYTEKQRRRFHAGAARGEPGMKKLAAEADAYAKAGKEKPPVAKKAAAKKTAKHPGFKAVQKKIAAKQGVSEERAGAMLAASTRKASPAAKKANPRLKNVKAAKKK